MTQTRAQQYMTDNSRGEIRPGLSRIVTLLERLGDPQTQMPLIHVAGTNGKGSVCAMIESILRSAGFRTGLYTSPHLIRVNEEIRVNGREITDAAFTDLIGRVSAQTDAMPDPPSRFEIMTAAALLHFRERGCEAAVIETGMGGTWDATNVIPAPEICVITNIGSDHTEYLGDTLQEIALQKAGIIKSGSDAVCYDLPPEVRDVIDAACRQQGVTARYADFAALRAGEAPADPDTAGSTAVSGGGAVFRDDGSCHFTYKRKTWPLSLAGAYQMRNAALTLEAVWALRERGWEIPDAAVSAGLSGVSWPARFEILSRDPLVILDGGHNVQCAAAFAESLRQVCGGQRVILVLGMLRDKEAAAVIRILAPLTARMICTTPVSERALPAEDLCRTARVFGIDARAVPNPAEALDAALSAAQTAGRAPIAVFGSLYLAGTVKETFMGTAGALPNETFSLL